MKGRFNRLKNETIMLEKYKDKANKPRDHIPQLTSSKLLVVFVVKNRRPR